MQNQIDLFTKEIRGMNLKIIGVSVSVIVTVVGFIYNKLNAIENKIDRYGYESISQHKVDSVQNHGIERRLDFLERAKQVSMNNQNMKP